MLQHRQGTFLFRACAQHGTIVCSHYSHYRPGHYRVAVKHSPEGTTYDMGSGSPIGSFEEVVQLITEKLSLLNLSQNSSPFKEIFEVPNPTIFLLGKE